MKNQYVGDINDYRKYGLLRVLQSEVKGKLLVAWMLTRDDSSRHGRLRSYLGKPDCWRQYDPQLFDSLKKLRSAPIRNVSLIERSSLLCNTSYFSEKVPDGRGDRDSWRQRLLDAARNIDLVFVDPDNGIEVGSKPVGRKGSSKYVTWNEIEGLWNVGCSLLIYQHFPREPREAFARRRVSELRKHIGAHFVMTFRTSHVLFLLAAQDRHVLRFRPVGSVASHRWNDQIKIPTRRGLRP